MIVDGAIDRGIVDQLLEGFGITVEDREIVMARHRKLIEDGDLARLVVVLKGDLEQLSARGRLSAQRTGKVAPIEGDLRSTLKNVSDADSVSSALGDISLANVLDD